MAVLALRVTDRGGRLTLGSSACSHRRLSTHSRSITVAFDDPIKAHFLLINLIGTVHERWGTWGGGGFQVSGSGQSRSVARPFTFPSPDHLWYYLHILFVSGRTPPARHGARIHPGPVPHPTPYRWIRWFPWSATHTAPFPSTAMP